MSFNNLKAKLAIAIFVGASALSAHDAKLHKGNATEGEIVSITGNSVVMKTAKGNMNVTLNKDTKFEMGDSAVDINHFKKGDKIAVIGTKLASGELVAKEFIMPMPSSKAGHAEGEHKH